MVNNRVVGSPEGRLVDEADEVKGLYEGRDPPVEKKADAEKK